ncbi:MAG: dual specificity protein phosphatase family protein [Actinomycetes bacterium]
MTGKSEGLGTYAELMPKEVWTEVYPNLWMGGTDDDDTIGRSELLEPRITKQNFDTVVSLHAWSNPVDWFVREIRQPFQDGEVSEFNEEDLNFLVRLICYELELGKNVLVRCLSGLNRSGLLVAMVLMNYGYCAKETIDHLRKTRSSLVLCNKDYVDWLLAKDSKLVTESGTKSDS